MERTLITRPYFESTYKIRAFKEGILIKWHNRKMLIKKFDENDKMGDIAYRIEFTRLKKPNEDVSGYTQNPIVIKDKIVCTNILLSNEAAEALCVGIRYFFQFT